MKKKGIIITLIAGCFTVFTFRMAKNHNGITNVIDLTLSEIEAIGGCESADGYNMDSHCMEGTGRCYYGEFTAKNCISNRV